MTPTVDDIEAAFRLMFESFLNRKFSKTLSLKYWSERELLPLVRTGLLCYFGDGVIPEAEVPTSWTKSGKSRVDFRIGTTAIEFAVRNPGKKSHNISARANTSERKKLVKWKHGRSVLVLYDFSNEPYPDNGFGEFRKPLNFGKGNHSKNAFTLLYFHVNSKRPISAGVYRKEIRRQARKCPN